jgi:carbonic anhydrase
VCRRRFELVRKIDDDEIAHLEITRSQFQGEWTCTIKPRCGNCSIHFFAVIDGEKDQFVSRALARVLSCPSSLEEGQVMRSPNHSSRRDFVRTSAVAAGAAGLALHAPALASSQGAAARAPDAVLARLLEGNKRFVDGKLAHPGRTPGDFAPLAEGQAPLAIIVGCADSRVSPELVFDQGVGELFVVRVAGNVISGAGAPVKGSIEFAVAELGARLIMVLGHDACGAIKAGIAHIDANDVLPGAIRDLVELMRPAAQAVRGQPGDKLENAIKANVKQGVELLKALDPIVAPLVKSGELKVVGAVYELRTGTVKMVD